MNKTIKYIKNTYNLLKENKETIFHGKDVFIQDPLPPHISLTTVLQTVEKIIPQYLVYNIDVLYVGDFEYFEQRNINAMYDNGALYVSNKQDDEEDMVDDIVHEISHAVEEKYQPEVYGDGKLEQEFLGKRKKLYEILKSYGYNVEERSFMNVEYQEDLDNLLYKGIGYEKLEFFTMNLFPSNYSATSLREYFGIGFEKYFLGDRADLANISPILFSKVERLANLEEEW
tara:strand:- start:124 stop:810 length:687 start_codon:yes stop_codon:yes gene_type:complete